MVPTISEYRQGLLEVPYMSFMSHNNVPKTIYRGKFISKFEKSSSTNITSGIGGLNLTPYLINPLMNLLLVLEA
jgi:hypothetical protein